MNATAYMVTFTSCPVGDKPGERITTLAMDRESCDTFIDAAGGAGFVVGEISATDGITVITLDEISSSGVCWYFVRRSDAVDLMTDVDALSTDSRAAAREQFDAWCLDLE